ncbi:MAG: Sua5/YciO/YrdC/YwlC family protein [Candidatus Paceibacterota bacterium]
MFGLDWNYYVATRFIDSKWWMPAGLLGFFLPVLVPIALYIFGRDRNNARILNTSFALGQAVILAYFISSIYKAFTGRIPPEFSNALVDISNGFQFGFWRGGIFNGWPSSHTTIAFAMIATLIVLYPENKKVKYLGILYALFVGLGASVGFHWLSEFIAGLIFGVLIGIVVGRSFKNRMVKSVWDNIDLIKTLQSGGVAVMPTDTLYGIIGSALNKESVERIYKIRGRDTSKPCIILIGDMNDLEKFSITLSKPQEFIIKSFTSFDSTQDIRPTSFVLDCPLDSLSYLHRGTRTLAFRIPQLAHLHDLLLKTGPLVAPSANTQGEEPAGAIIEAKKYFGDNVDVYVDGGVLYGRASKVVRLSQDGSITTIRE